MGNDVSLVIRGREIRALGFIGLGVMGEPMCAHLMARSNLPVYGTDRADSPVAALSKLGMIACANALEIGQQADVTFICVANGDQLQEVCFGRQGLVNKTTRTKAIIDCSTTSVALTRTLAARCDKLGVIWVDAPIARGREAARAGTLSIMVGADEALFEELVPLLKYVGTDVTRCGKTGCGQVVKILNNKVMIQTVHALAEALAIARASGVDGKLLFDLLSNSSADSQSLRNQGFNSLLPGTFPRSAFPTSYARKDIGLAISLAEEAGINACLAETTADLLDQAIEAGHALNYYPVILKLLEHHSGAKSE
jgi:3-hydroxyisobutyrate dehydrogenase-like beta-hydroxyacid dehydrogenase